MFFSCGCSVGNGIRLMQLDGCRLSTVQPRPIYCSVFHQNTPLHDPVPVFVDKVKICPATTLKTRCYSQVCGTAKYFMFFEVDGLLPGDKVWFSQWCQAKSTIQTISKGRGQSTTLYWRLRRKNHKAVPHLTTSYPSRDLLLDKI
jgi:hypothetical protein